MNKKILISLAIIGLTAAIAAGATTAYFTDTAESEGNTFTAGNLVYFISYPVKSFAKCKRLDRVFNGARNKPSHSKTFLSAFKIRVTRVGALAALPSNAQNQPLYNQQL